MGNPQHRGRDADAAHHLDTDRRHRHHFFQKKKIIATFNHLRLSIDDLGH